MNQDEASRFEYLLLVAKGNEARARVLLDRQTVGQRIANRRGVKGSVNAWTTQNNEAGKDRTMDISAANETLNYIDRAVNLTAETKAVLYKQAAEGVLVLDRVPEPGVWMELKIA